MTGKKNRPLLHVILDILNECPKITDEEIAELNKTHNLLNLTLCSRPKNAESMSVGRIFRMIKEKKGLPKIYEDNELCKKIYNRILEKPSVVDRLAHKMPTK